MPLISATHGDGVSAPYTCVTAFHLFLEACAKLSSDSGTMIEPRTAGLQIIQVVLISMWKNFVPKNTNPGEIQASNPGIQVESKSNPGIQGTKIPTMSSSSVIEKELTCSVSVPKSSLTQ
ncbi:Protein of unknown function [Pyronema omphalodes CBS 100304]|uniref:Uncharacterized protein n=1 Tax=Pyronema omphalodes (strain CBS 100304) TaxID=1076935 RepID=U4KYX8_PYROM|nr:Protein of unknown function [Pyronema omphalodes CBS 100304]